MYAVLAAGGGTAECLSLPSRWKFYLRLEYLVTGITESEGTLAFLFDFHIT